MSVQATLLPEAKIDVFASDPQTIEVARQLLLDWRFARIRLGVSTGDITTAVARYAQEKSPDLMIIETNAIDESFTGQLEALANVCDMNTAAVFVGPQNDITLYRRLLDMGAADYLVRPLQANDLVEVIAKTLLNRLGTSDSRVISVMGAKGGVGTSRMAQVLAQALSRVENSVTLLDCGGSWGLSSVTFGREPIITLRDLATLVRTQADTLDDLVHKVTSHLSWIATGGDQLLNSTLTSDGIEGIIDAFSRRHPNIVMDLSQSATGIRTMAFAKSHHIVLVTAPTPLALRNARLLLKEIHQLRGTDVPIHLVVNGTGMLPKEELSASDIRQALGLTPSVQVSFQPDVFAQLDTADPTPAVSILNSLSSSFDPIVKAVTGRSLRQDGAANGDKPNGLSLLNKLLKRG